MNKRIKFLISVTLIFAIFVSSFILPASSFENEIEVSTDKLLLVNIDTNTEVYSKDADTKWYAGYLSELMTFITAYEMIDDLDHMTVKLDKDYLSKLPSSDGCLNLFLGKELSAKELMGIMLITSGNDAANALADLATGGDRDAFVDEMNSRAKRYGMNDTNFVSPAYSDSDQHVITCRDLYRLYMRALKIDLYMEIMGKKSYIPESLYVEGDIENNERYTLYPEASILNINSPYYFKYVDSAKLSVTGATKQGVGMTSLYHGKRYFFAALNGLNESEKNVYADARKLISWAYLHLTDRKLISADQKVSDVKIKTGWGEYTIALYPPGSVVKTLPKDFEEYKLEYKENIPEELSTPLRIGETAGSIGITYDDEEVGTVRLSSKTEEGLSMMPDFGRFCTYVFSRLTPFVPEGSVEANSDVLKPEATLATQPPTEPPTEAPTQPVNDGITGG
ncbi:hypothetical protein [Ruminococcus sp.]|uniref:hypothetical protein n=1 Tax=Ruminococcus sp. TaxID=41978 RepID=UPI00388FABED